MGEGGASACAEGLWGWWWVIFGGIEKTGRDPASAGRWWIEVDFWRLIAKGDEGLIRFG